MASENSINDKYSYDSILKSSFNNFEYDTGYLPHGFITINSPSPLPNNSCIAPSLSSPNFNVNGTYGLDTGMTYNTTVTFEKDVIINGINVSEFLDTLSKRLAILVPNPEKLAQYESLQKAYDHYKLLESLLDEPSKNGK